MIRVIFKLFNGGTGMRRLILCSLLFLSVAGFAFREYASGQVSGGGERIKDERAKALFAEATKSGSSLKRIKLLDKADSIEPNNPIILHERGLAKFNAKQDVEGAFKDLAKSIYCTKSPQDKEVRYNNRGLCYMEIGDIEAACSDWKAAGRIGQHYTDTYCTREFDKEIKRNPDSRLEIQFQLLDEEAIISSSHNPPAISDVLAKITIHNLSHGIITIKKKDLTYDMEAYNSALYLEAIGPSGRKFHFFSNSGYSEFIPDDDYKLTNGNSFSIEQNITSRHHFPYAGQYKIRIGLRPSDDMEGLSETYYSNWQVLHVKRK